MFRFIVLAVCVAAVASQGYGPKNGYADDYSEPRPYEFGFNIKDDYNSQINRQESGDGNGNVQGSYGYQDAAGIYRQVEYTADDYGFKANIKTNEPGTDNQNPADVSIYADPIQIKYDAPKYGYKNTHKAVAHSASYAAPVYGHRAAGYATPSYGHGLRSYAAPSYGHGLRSYAAPSYGHARSYATPSYGHRATYAAVPSYGLGQRSYGVPSHGYGSAGYSAPSYGYGRTVTYKANRAY